MGVRSGLCELPRIEALKLSEKGFEQGSERGFGRYTDGYMDRKEPAWRSVGLRCRSLRPFSDSFSRNFA
jgi:hypothetical protein